MAEQFFPGQPDIGYSGSDQDKPKGLQMGSSEALRAIGETIGGENGFENMPTAVGREYGSQVRDTGLLARVMTLEARMAVGAELYDTFNRNPNSTTLGVPTTGTTLSWIQFGDGQNLGIEDEAAQLSRDSAVFDSLPDDGTRYALTPSAATSNNYTISLAIHPRIGEKIATRARTSFYGRCNAAGTEGVYVDMYGDRCLIGRFTRSGLTMSRSQWDQNVARSYSYSSSPELKMVDNRYIVLIDGVTVLDVEDVSGFPVDANHRYSMFSVMCWTGILFQKPEFSAGVTVFSVRGANLTAIEAATTAANNAEAAAGAVLGVAENADAKATAAQQAVVTVKKEIIQKIVAFDIKSPTPGYVAINGTEWPSIPHSDLEMMPADVYIDAHLHGENNESGVLAKTDNTTIGAVAVRMTRFPEKMMSAGQQWFSFIRIPVDTPLSGLNFYARGTPSDLRTRVYSMSATGDMTAVTPESDNLAGLLVANKHTSTPTNFVDALIEAGTWVAVRFRVVGTVWLAGKEKFAPERPAGFYPRQLNATTALTSGTASPDSIAESSVTWPVDQGFVPYVAVGNNIIVTPVKRSLSDNFDRADTGDARQGIGSNWSLQQTTMGVIDRFAGVRIYQNAIIWRGSGDGSAEHKYATPLTTEKVAGRFRIGEPATTAWTRALARVGGSSGLAIGVRAGAITLDKRTGFNAYTTSFTVARTLVSGDAISYQIGTDTNPDEVFVWHNGVEVIHTSSVVVPSGPGKRYCGVFLQRTPNNDSTAILDWEAYDLSDVEPPAP